MEYRTELDLLIKYDEKGKYIRRFSYRLILSEDSVNNKIPMLVYSKNGKTKIIRTHCCITSNHSSVSSSEVPVNL